MNRATIKKYKLNYNYETMKTFKNSFLMNPITQFDSDTLIEQQTINNIQPKEIAILRNSQEYTPLFSHESELTVGNYQRAAEIELTQRKRRYIDYFRRHFGNL
jgi:hypothetical protein